MAESEVKHVEMSMEELYESVGYEDLVEAEIWCGHPDCYFCKLNNLVPKTFEEANERD